MKDNVFSLHNFFFVLILGFILDLVSKTVIRLANIETTGHVLDSTPLFNHGTMWGLFSSVTFINIVFIIISIAALVLLYYFQKDHASLRLPLAIVSAGILGNLFDRIVYGAVFDFINVHFWPVFNLADSFIVCGVLLALFIVVKEEFDKKK